jgi:hypothetical protein
MYFGSFVGAMLRAHLESGMYVGINPYTEWESRYLHILKPDPSGKRVWDGDFAGFDSSQMPTLLWCLLKYINSWYSLRNEDKVGVAVDNKVREILFLDLINSKHLMSLFGTATTVVSWSKSLPSGHFLTSTVNSMLSLSLIVSGYLELTGDGDFWGHASAATMGDDNLASVDYTMAEYFNQVTLAEYLKQEYGMTYTAGRKGEELKEFVGCPIRPESFLFSLYYTNKGTEVYKNEVLCAGIENALEELSMHDESKWLPVARKLATMKKSLGQTTNLMYEDGSTSYLETVLSKIPSYL